MKAFGEIICCGILIFKLMLCSASDGLTEDQLKEIYKLGTAKEDIIVSEKNYKIYKGETKGSSKRVWMKMENPVEVSGKVKEEKPKVSSSKATESKNKKEDKAKAKAPASKAAENKKAAEAKPKASCVSNEIEVLKNLKKGNKNLLSEYITDMLHHGIYDGKKVLISTGLGKNLKEHSSKGVSWDELSKMGPCMIKALKFLHDHHYIHRNLKPEIFAFGTKDKQSSNEVVPLQNRVYLFDVGLAEKDSIGNHKEPKKVNEFFGDMTFASRAAMGNMSQSKRDDIESLYYVLAHLAGFKSVFEVKEPKKLHDDKFLFCSNHHFIKSVFDSSKADVRVLNAFLDFSNDLGFLFHPDYEGHPEYENFVNCFDQGLSDKEIQKTYKFENAKDFKSVSGSSLMGQGYIKTDPNKKLVMKLRKTKDNPDLELSISLSFTTEVRVYKDLKKGLKHSLLHENVCDMLDFGIYDGRKAIILSRLGLDWLDYVTQNFPNGSTYELICEAAIYAIGALKFVHKRGYVHQDLKPDNFAFGTEDCNKSNSSHADVPVKGRLYLLDFGMAEKWKYANNTHKPRIKIVPSIGTKDYKCRTTIDRFSQSRRDDMESLFYTFIVAATGRFVFPETNDKNVMLAQRNKLLKDRKEIIKTFKDSGIKDERVHNAFIKYAEELNKLFVSDEPKYYEKEPNYDAFCAIFGAGSGDNAGAKGSTKGIQSVGAKILKASSSALRHRKT